MKLETKMRLQSLGVWWAVCFLAFNFIAEIILGTGRDASAMLKTAAVCAVLAVPADLLMYFVILKKTDKEYQNYQKIAAVVAEHGGMCDEAVNMLEEGFRRCAARKNSYAEGYAVDLAEVYAGRGDIKKAYEYISYVNVAELEKNIKYTAFLFSLVRYYTVLLSIDVKAGDKERADRDHAAAEPVFARLDKDSPYQPSMKCAEAEYFLMSGRYEEALSDAESIVVKDDASRLAVNIHKAQAFLKLGRKDEARNLLREARELNKNEQLDAQLRDLPEKCGG